MKKILVLLIIITTAQIGFIQSFADSAEPNSTPSEFTPWASCPRNLQELTETFAKIDGLSSRVESLSDEAKMQMIEKNEWQGVYVQFFASHLLSENLLTSATDSCWINYVDLKSAAEAKNLKLVKEEAKDWETCITLKFQSLPPIITSILSCIKKIKAI